MTSDSSVSILKGRLLRQEKRNPVRRKKEILQLLQQPKWYGRSSIVVLYNNSNSNSTSDIVIVKAVAVLTVSIFAAPDVRL